ncbi:type II toxin-antitoxin system YafQ family toxin [Selenomonas sputigena]|uniref:type II toxin-antitoxin system YafQ family toxin n=1 Tax=Selenomonas sputigena TaxID=69823 RepID=UPI0022306F0F|nr:type II toxin-antitoxin system YafQ family toxin [Selenomonas sputigena]UZD42914.1 type II toxin-antitoxin system YafQ family toxin [Selenomonas sputigena]
MQYELKYTRAFRRGYKRAKKRGLNLSLLGEIVEMLRCGKKLPKKYADHCLSGDFSQCRECHIQPDWLLVYRIDDDILTLTLMDTGTHAELFH